MKYFFLLFLGFSVVFAQKTISVTYTCNMELEIASGRFLPNESTLRLPGDAFTWDETAPALIPDPINPNFYFVTIDQTLSPEENIPSYKFCYYIPKYDIITYEGGSSRTHKLSVDDYNSGYFFIDRTFNDALPDESGNNITIRFLVDANGAKSAIDGTDLSPYFMHIAGNTYPLMTPSSYWPPEEVISVIPLYDNGIGADETESDAIFSSYLQFPKGTKAFNYKFSINYEIPFLFGGGAENELPAGIFHSVELPANLSSATIFNKFGDLNSTVISNVVTSAEKIETGVIPENHFIRNYPNPFNPSTNITFGITKKEFVSLKVYNLLGQELSTLVAQELTPGEYNYRFNAAGLPSGVYMYKIQAGNYSEVKRMLLMK